MPRKVLTARDILDQAGVGSGLVLVRDHNSPNDVVFADTDVIDLGHGNVFRVIPACEAGPQDACTSPPKLAFVCNDAWEVTVVGKQPVPALKRLFGLKGDVELLRDFESPHDVPLDDGEIVHFGDGCVFISRSSVITVKVNNKEVHFRKRKVTGLEIKETAIKQGVKIDVGCVLYPVKPDGSLGAAIRDDDEVILKPCDKFNCVAPDDNS